MKCLHVSSLLGLDEAVQRDPDAGTALRLWRETRACTLGNVIVHVSQAACSAQRKDGSEVVSVLLFLRESEYCIF